MPAFSVQHVVNVDHWSPSLFSFTLTRPPGFRFENGQFVMLGLPLDGERRLARAYSIASANYEEVLEFYSIIAPQGDFTSRLQCVEPGSPVLLGAKPTGTLVLRDLRAGRRLLLFCTGTGVAPFCSLIRDPATYDAFEQVILVRSAASQRGHAFASGVLTRLKSDSYLAELAASQLLDYATTTREPSARRERVTSLLESGRLCQELGIAPLDVANDRFMICGNMRMVKEMATILGRIGFKASAGIGEPGDYLIERAFVEALPLPPQPREAAAQIA